MGFRNLIHALASAWRSGSPENPSTSLADPAPYLYAALGGDGLSGAGVMVTPTSAMRHAAVFACVRNIAEDVASLPLHLYGEKRRKAIEHPLYPLLHDAPNPMMTSMVWRECSLAHVQLWGNAYSEIERDQAGRILALWPVPPWLCEPKLSADGLRLVYEVRLNGRTAIIQPENMLHIPGLGFDGIKGKGVLAHARDTIGLGVAAEAFGSSFFRNASRPSGALKLPPTVDPKKGPDVLKLWNEANAGLDKASRTALLTAGAEWQKIGLTNEEAQFIESRKFQIAEIARMWRMPPPMIGDLERATFGNVENLSLQYVVHTLRPWCVRVEQELQRKVTIGTGLHAELSVQGLMRGDIAARTNYYRAGRQWGWLSANDICELENRPPIGDQGDIYLMPGNMVDASADPADNGAAGAAGAATPTPNKEPQP